MADRRGDASATSAVPGGDDRVASDVAVVSTAAPTEHVDVLIVDDDEGVRNTTAKILRRRGYRVAEAHDGLAAWVLMQRYAVGIVILDLRMPSHDGRWLLERLDDYPPVVVISAFSGSLDRSSYWRLVSDVLAKPVSPETLLGLVEQEIGEPRRSSD